MKWGIVGASFIAETRMVDAIKASGGEIVGLLSSSEDRAGHFYSQHGIEMHTKVLDEFLSWEMDNVYISSINNLHAKQTIESLKSGKNVLCEKPLATSTADAIEMFNQSIVAGKVLGVNHHLRYSKTNQMARELIKDGAIGKVFSIRMSWSICLHGWDRSWLYQDNIGGGGVYLNLTAHNVDLARFFINEKIVSVSSMSSNTGFNNHGIEDESFSIFKSESGVLISTYESFNVPFSESSVEIMGSGGTIFIKNAMSQDPDSELYLSTDRGVEMIYCGAPEDLYVRLLNDFQNNIFKNEKMLSDGLNGVYSTHIALAAQESARAGQTILLKEIY